MLKVYMFHYVTEGFNYYHFDIKQFEKVVKELVKTKKVINLKELKKIQLSDESEYVLLTFDDGTIDHYENVYRILKKYNVTGVFFICSNIFREDILEINLIHQILNKVSVDKLYIDVRRYLKENNILDKYNDVNSRINNWKEVYIKKLIQIFLPQEYKEQLLKKLVKKYDISINYKKYYMSIQNMLEMKKDGMEFGCHTNSHRRLSFLDEMEQSIEIEENMKLLYKNKLVTKNDVLTIAYPFGDYNDSTIKILNNLKFDFAFTVKEGEIYDFDKYQLPRYDCNVLKE